MKCIAMDKRLADWCKDRIARARNALQVIQLGHRHYIDEIDVTQRVRTELESDVENLSAIYQAWLPEDKADDL